MKNENNNLAILILAAGSSIRLGQPKQLVPFQGKPLLQNVIDLSISICPKVTVVLGANHALIQSKIDFDKIEVLFFDNWPEGIGASIAFGVEQVLASNAKTEQILILLCDQIHVSKSLLDQLTVAHHRSNQLITACSYGDTFGVPAIFEKSTFSELLKLRASQGAKTVIKNYIKKAHFVEFPDGTVDIDTPDDLNELH